MDALYGVRHGNVVLGTWMFLSAILWPHAAQEFANAMLIGILVAVIAMIGIWMPVVGYANMLLGIWLFTSVWLLPHLSLGTVWNDVSVAVAIVVLTLVPAPPEVARRIRTLPISSLHDAPST